MTENQNLDALVIGAGPTGLAMATDLIRHGMKVRLIDLADKPSTLSKAVVLMPRTLEEFQVRGLHKRTQELGENVHSFSAYNQGQIIFHADYDRISSKYNFLLNISQCDTELVLREELDRLGGEIEWGVTLTDYEDLGDHVRADLKHADGKTETLEVPYLLGCDGAHSTVRHGMNAEFHGESYQDTWLLADVSIDWKFPHGHSYSFFCEDGLLAVFPMPGKRYRIYVLQTLEYQLGRDPELSDIIEAVERVAPGLCKLSEPEWLSEFHCHHRKVKHYSKKNGRVFIGGDAAHIHSPETGLGMNTGVQDAFNLAWKLANVRKGLMPESLLDTYDLERSYVGEQVVKLSDFTHKLLSQFTAMGGLVRSKMWRFFSNYYLNHFQKLEEGFQVRIHYKANDFVEHHGHAEHFRIKDLPEVTAGARCLDGNLLPPNTEADVENFVSLYDQLDPSVHQLMILTGSDHSQETQSCIRELIASTASIRSQLNILLILGRQDTEGYEDLDATILLDPTHHFHHKYGAEAGAVYVVRPDTYVGFFSRPIASKPVTKYLKSLFTKLEA